MCWSAIFFPSRDKIRINIKILAIHHSFLVGFTVYDIKRKVHVGSKQSRKVVLSLGENQQIRENQQILHGRLSENLTTW